MTLLREVFGIIVQNGEHAVNQLVPLFPQCFLTYQTEIIIFANAVNLNKSNNSLFGKVKAISLKPYDVTPCLPCCIVGLFGGNLDFNMDRIVMMPDEYLKSQF